MWAKEIKDGSGKPLHVTSNWYRHCALARGPIPGGFPFLRRLARIKLLCGGRVDPFEWALRLGNDPIAGAS